MGQRDLLHRVHYSSRWSLHELNAILANSAIDLQLPIAVSFDLVVLASQAHDPEQFFDSCQADCSEQLFNDLHRVGVFIHPSEADHSNLNLNSSQANSTQQLVNNLHGIRVLFHSRGANNSLQLS